MWSDIKKLNLFDTIKRWWMAKARLLQELDELRDDNARLRAKVAALQNAKVKTERSLDERRREKEALRARLNSEKKSLESKERIAEQLGSKIAELRDENDRLLRGKKKTPPSE